MLVLRVENRVIDFPRGHTVCVPFRGLAAAGTLVTAAPVLEIPERDGEPGKDRGTGESLTLSRATCFYDSQPGRNSDGVSCFE